MTVRITGIEEIERAFDPSAVRRALQAATEAVAHEAEDRISPYPAQSHRPQPFVSDKQRRGFFARLRAGQIQVPYQRGGAGSETLGQRWNVYPAGTTGARLENNASYADLVHGAQTQTAYHAGTGWKTDEGVADEIEADGTAQRAAEQAVSKVLGL